MSAAVAAWTEELHSQGVQSKRDQDIRNMAAYLVKEGNAKTMEEALAIARRILK